MTTGAARRSPYTHQGETKMYIEPWILCLVALWIAHLLEGKE
jgi:hypothetical protein